MYITVNGRTQEIAPDLTLHDLVVSLGLDPSVVIAELNHDIVSGERFDSTGLNAGDSLELLSFVGGG